MSIFLVSNVFPRIVPVENCRGAYNVEVEVNWYREDGKFDHFGKRLCLGTIHDDDYIDQDALITAMYRKTIYEAHNILMNWESD